MLVELSVGVTCCCRCRWSVLLSGEHANTAQRCAGREAPGKVYRLYTEAMFGTLEPVTAPEIQRTNLVSVVLQLKVRLRRA